MSYKIGILYNRNYYMSIKMILKRYGYMTLTKTNTQAKYQNRISYHLLLCFLAENDTVRFISN